MMTRLREVNDVASKKIASFDVKALFTNVSVPGALSAIRTAIDGLDDDDLPLPKADYIEMVKLCMNFGCFSFNDEEYLQKSGLAMGSPLSPVAACLYMESLEKSKFFNIIGSDSLWLRYVDDVLVVVPDDTDLEQKLRQLNSVDEKVQFTVEFEQDGKIAFLDTCIIKQETCFKFKVYRKPTNREDYVHYYSGHNQRVKSGIVIGFLLRALRICDREYLDDEIEHIYEAFTRLKYPKGFIKNKQRKKAEQIRKKNKSPDQNKTTSKRKSRTWISIPYSKGAEVISRKLEKAGMKVSMTSGMKTRELIEREPKRTSVANPRSVVYEIPCGGCYKSYVGETGRGIEIRLKEHKSDVRFHRLSNAIVLHFEKCNHLPDWEGTKILEKNIKKQTRKILEAAHISSRDTFNSRNGFISLAACAVKAAAHYAIRRAECRVRGGDTATCRRDLPTCDLPTFDMPPNVACFRAHSAARHL